MISIIIPIYNRAHQVGKCLDSIKNQSYKDFELIIVNDGSTDNIQEVLGGYKDIFAEKLRIINQEKSGAPKARNNGVKISKGEFIIFCDADVIMDKDMLKIMEEKLRNNPNLGYVYSSFKWREKTFNLWPFDEERLKKMPYIHTTSLIRKIFFPGFDENIKKMQDWDLWLTMLDKGYKGEWVNKILFKKQGGATMSTWLPSFTYKLFPFLPIVKNYNQAVKIIKNKHNLPY